MPGRRPRPTRRTSPPAASPCPSPTTEPGPAWTVGRPGPHRLRHQPRRCDAGIGLGSHDLGVSQSAIIIEPEAANTGQNITCSRRVLVGAGITPNMVMLISKPYMQRRAYATAREPWPEVSTVCASEDLSLDDYLKQTGDDKLVTDTLVGDLQRVIEYPARGFAIAQEVPRR